MLHALELDRMHRVPNVVCCHEGGGQLMGQSGKHVQACQLISAHKAPHGMAMDAVAMCPVAHRVTAEVD